jgi:hypothetical protein
MKVLLAATSRRMTPIPAYPVGSHHVANALEGRHGLRVSDLDEARRDFQP